MDKEAEKKEILHLISEYYNKSQEKALTWYDTPHKLLSDRNESPKDLVEKGYGAEVVKWIKMVLDK